MPVRLRPAGRPAAARSIRCRRVVPWRRATCYPAAMPRSEPDIVHLVALIQAAKLEAERLGARAGGTAARLDAALVEARAILGNGGRPDQGLRPENLTTANDQ